MMTLLAIVVPILLGGAAGYFLGRAKSKIREAELSYENDPILQTRLRMKGLIKNA